jgi:hypothetical protein
MADARNCEIGTTLAPLDLGSSNDMVTGIKEMRNFSSHIFFFFTEGKITTWQPRGNYL